MIVWTQEHIDRLKELADSGIDYKKAALAMTKQFKLTFTYHMVVSKARDHYIKFARKKDVKKASSHKWRDQVLETLRTMIANGYSGAGAAAELSDLYGELYTRNAVIAKCRTSGIKMLYNSQTFVPRSKQKNKRRTLSEKPVKKAVKKEPVTSHTFDVNQSVHLTDIVNGQCRMPVSVRDFKTIGEMLSTEGADAWYCGRPIETGSYCNHCHKIAYTPSRSVKINRLWSLN